MEFDEYEYLEKTVEEQQRERDGTKRKKEDNGDEKGQRSYRRRDGVEEEEEDGLDDDRLSSRSKRSRGDGDENGGRAKDRDKERHRSSRDEDRDRPRERNRESEKEKKYDTEGSSEKERDRERKERGRDVETDRDTERKERERERERERRSSSRSRRERERERRSSSRSRREERERERETSSSRSRREERKRERGTRSSSRSRREERERERDTRSSSRSRRDEREREPERERRYKDKKEAAEPEVDPERDQRTVFAYQMPLKATERDVYEFFSKVGKVRDVRLIMDRNSRRSKGVGYIEFYDVMSVPMAIAMSGQLLLGQPVMVKPSEAEKNLVQSTTNAAGGANNTGPVDRKLYVGNLHFNMSELQLRQIFEPFGPVELVQLPLDLETGQCKGFGFIQFAQLEHAKAAQNALNGKLEIAGRTIKVSSVADYVGTQDSAPKSADFDDEDGGGLALNAQSRALLMQKLDRSGIATSIVGALGIPAVNGAAANQPGLNLAAGGHLPFPPPAIPSPAIEPIGQPSECLLLKNMFDPATETEPDFDLDIKEDVEEECSKYGSVKHIYVDKNSAGFVYLRFESVQGAAAAQRAMHTRWFARKMISAIFMPPQEYEAKFKA